MVRGGAGGEEFRGGGLEVSTHTAPSVVSDTELIVGCRQQIDKDDIQKQMRAVKRWCG